MTATCVRNARAGSKSFPHQACEPDEDGRLISRCAAMSSYCALTNRAAGRYRSAEQSVVILHSEYEQLSKFPPKIRTP